MFIALCLFTTACSNQQESTSNDGLVLGAHQTTSSDVEEKELSTASEHMNNKSRESKSSVTLTGQIVYQQFEGGFYGFIASDGSKYTLSNLPKEHNVNGIVLKLSGEILHDVMTTVQFGQVLRVNDVSVLDNSQVKRVRTKPQDL